MKAYGILGGTFDPVHIAHLRLALEVRETFGLDGVRFIPARIPPHRGKTEADSEQRLAMVRLALEGLDSLSLDTRELRRGGPSYMIDTLKSLREDFPEQPCCLILGSDAFVALDTWHHWQSLLDYCHLIVASRPGSTFQGNATLEQWVNPRLTDRMEELHAASAGKIFFFEMHELAISASRIRAACKAGKEIRFLVPDKVYQYIHHHRLYMT